MTDQIRQFVECVYEPDDTVEIRAIGKRDGERAQIHKQWTRAGALSEQASDLAALNRQGFDVYVGLNARTGGGVSGDKSVATCRCLFADFDGLAPECMQDEALNRIMDAELPLPTLIVASGHGVHAYWRLREPIDPGKFYVLQARLAYTLDSDRKVKNPERVTRLPGFDNVKAEPVPCRIIAGDPARRFDVVELASKIKEIPQAQEIVAAPQHPAPLEVRGRATLYIAKCPGVVEGERNDAAFRHAKHLLNDFDLDPSEAWSLLVDWNRGNQPPLSEAELRQTFDSAGRSPSAKPRGCKLDGPSNRHRNVKPSTKAEHTQKPSATLGDLLDATIDGRRTAIDWPWPDLSRPTEALIPGTVTVLCGPKGVSKTFFLLSCLTTWTLHDLKCAMLILEEDTTHCLLRCLAQLSGVPQLTKSKWVRQNPAEVHRLHAAHAQQIDRIGAGLWDTPDDEMSLPEIAGWIDARAAEGCRIVIADPITAAKQTDNPWKSDTTFVNEVKRIARRRGISVILATHPIKHGSNIVSMDSLAGSTAWVRFAQTILWLESHDPKDAVVMTSCGRAMVSTNRTLHILAARNSYGAGRRIGFTFTDNLGFRCEGMILRKSERTE